MSLIAGPDMSTNLRDGVTQLFLLAGGNPEYMCYGKYATADPVQLLHRLSAEVRASVSHRIRIAAVQAKLPWLTSLNVGENHWVGAEFLKLPRPHLEQVVAGKTSDFVHAIKQVHELVFLYNVHRGNMQGEE